MSLTSRCGTISPGSYELTSVKTTNMGSLFRLTYNLTLRDSRNRNSHSLTGCAAATEIWRSPVSKQETAIGEL